MKRILRGLAMAAVLVMGTSSAACAGTGWEDVLAGNTGLYDRQVNGVVRDVNTRSRRIEVRTDRGGYETVRYDGRTEVLYGSRRYSPGALRDGDRVSVRATRDRRGDLVAERVYVRQTSRERYDHRDDRDRYGDRDRYDRSSGRVLEGRVGRVDPGRRMFEVRTSRGTVWATLVSPTSRERDRVRSLRAGDYVRLRGRFTSHSRFEADSFR
jgi:hypothetical protein